MTRSRDVANIDGILTTTGDMYVASAAATPARLGIGSTGQVLTVAGGTASWATPAAGGTNWSLVNAGGTALTGATTITVSGISGADKLMIIIEEASSGNASSTISVQLTSDTASNYYTYGGSFKYPTTYSAGGFDRVSGANSQIPISGLSNNAASRANGYVSLTGCNASGDKMFIANGMSSQSIGDGPTAYNIGGYYSSASTISSVSVKSSSGNFDNGTVFIYKSA